MIEVQDLIKTYNTQKVETNVLKGISFTIQEGEFVMLLGKSGCGKSTLLNILGGIDQATDGSYRFRGEEVSGFRDKELSVFRNKKIGYIFQAYHLIADLDALHNVEVPLGYAGMKKKDRRRLSEEALKKVGLEDRTTHYPSQLSGGQQQRVAIARAIVHQPDVILADEPTGNLDEENCRSIMELLAQLHRNGATIVMVTHDEELTQYATRVIRMKDGMIA